MAVRGSAKFNQRTKTELAERAGNKCSQPDCGVETKAAKDGSRGVSNIGAAAHIHGAAPGSARYDTSMTNAERADMANGIWLCQNHHKMVDDDEEVFPARMLLSWKVQREELQRRVLGQTVGIITKRDPVSAATQPDALVQLGHMLAKASQRSWWKRVQRFVDAASGSRRLRELEPARPVSPGEFGFLWSYSDAPLDLLEHARQAMNTLRWFMQSEVPPRVGSYRPQSHPLFQVQRRSFWRESAWPDRRRDLFECYVEPVLTVIEASTSEAKGPPHSAMVPLGERHRVSDDPLRSWLTESLGLDTYYVVLDRLDELDRRQAGHELRDALEQLGFTHVELKALVRLLWENEQYERVCYDYAREYACLEFESLLKQARRRLDAGDIL